MKLLRREMRKEPNFIGHSFALVVTLRQGGIFDNETPRRDAASIPRTVVQFWDRTEIPSDIEELMSSWSKHCQGFNHDVFDDARATAFIAEHCEAKVLKAFRLAAHAAMRSDIFRLAYLSVSGGIYADADDMCRHDISPMLGYGYDLILLQENIGSIGNNFIAAAPDHPMIAAALNYVVKQVIEQQGDNIWFLTGPGAMTHVFVQFYINDLKRMCLPSGIRVWDVYRMHQFFSPNIPRQYKQDNQHWVSPKNLNRPLFRKKLRNTGNSQ